MTTTTSTTTPPLTAALAGQLADDPAWADAFTDSVSVHLAVMGEPYLGYILDGSKTIESRFSRVRCAPAGVVSSGDVIAFKRTGGPVVAACRAGAVRNFDQLTPSWSSRSAPSTPTRCAPTTLSSGPTEPTPATRPSSKSPTCAP